MASRDEDGQNYEEGGEYDAAETNPTADEEKELEEMKKKVEEMEAEARKLQELQENMQGDSGSKEEADARSVFVGGVDFGATAEELQQHFKSCGTINRITILTDKWTGQPKGYAYIEFVDISSVANALELNESVFRGRPLKVTAKRTNLPAFALGRGGGGGRGRGRGRGRGAPFYAPPMYGAYPYPPAYPAPYYDPYAAGYSRGAPRGRGGFRGAPRGGRGGYYGAPY